MHDQAFFITKHFLSVNSIPGLTYSNDLCKRSNEPIANRSFVKLDELESITIHRCRVLMERRELIRGLTNFYWWEEAVS
jgi:hypothetical protein